MGDTRPKDPHEKQRQLANQCRIKLPRIFHKTTSQPGKESSYGGENNSPASNHAPKYRKNSVKEQNTTQIPLSNFVKT